MLFYHCRGKSRTGFDRVDGGRKPAVPAAGSNHSSCSPQRKSAPAVLEVEDPKDAKNNKSSSDQEELLPMVQMNGSTTTAATAATKVGIDAVFV